MQASAGLRIATRKQPAAGSHGAVAAAHPLAVAAGIEMLARGGNAIDAAVSMAVTLTVVEPFMSSLFGAGCTVARLAGGEILCLDHYSVAPAAAHATMYDPLPPAKGLFNARDDANNIGYLAVGVPGNVACYQELMRRAGTLPWEVVFGPAIRAAEEGYRVTPLQRAMIAQGERHLRRFRASAEVFLPGGQVPEVGAVIRRPDYAETLREVARTQGEAFYRGSIADAVAADMKANGGLITREDLASYRLRVREPIRGEYRGRQLVAMAPTSSGGVGLVHLLNILEGYDLGALGFGTEQSVHLIAEAMKIVFADRDAVLGDPDLMSLPIERLTSKEYAEECRARIDLERAREYPSRMVSGDSQHTTHLSAIDSQGNMVAITQTLNGLFGSYVTVPGTGMLLNNNMRLFDPRPGRPNSVGPGKRMLSSMCPALLFDRDGSALAIGVPGGTRIFNAVAQAIMNLVDHGMTLQEAVEAPRMHTGTVGDGLLLERGHPVDDGALKRRGHRIERVGKVAGGMHAVMASAGGKRLEGVSCWRSDGAAAAWSGGSAADESFIF